MKNEKWEAAFKRIDELDKKFRNTEQFLADYQQTSELIKEHLTTCGDDLILLTLKGHLLIETWLELILCRVLRVDALPSNVEDKLEFNQKLKLVQAVVISRKVGPNADLFCAIVKLNSVRNQLAHNLRNSQQLDTAIKSVIASFQSKADTKLMAGDPVAAQLRSCIRRLCKFLFDVRKHLYKLDNEESK